MEKALLFGTQSYFVDVVDVKMLGFLRGKRKYLCRVEEEEHF